MENYKAALYQRDVMNELDRQADVVFYGPGFEGFDPAKRINRVLDDLRWGIDFVMVGHAWLADYPGEKVDPYPGLYLEECELPKAVILNKEYTNLDAKLDWVRDKTFFRGFSHHHDVEYFAEWTKIPFAFCPFAVNHHLFGYGPDISKDIDLAFSGILQNQGHNAMQSDIRVRVTHQLFYCLGDIPLFPRRKYKDHNIFWNSIPRKKWQRRIASLTKRRRFLLDEEYRDMQRRAKIYFNTLSPVGLVGPRFAENMATKALVFCQNSENVTRIFPDDCFVSFRSDLADFDEKLTHYLRNYQERCRIVQRAHGLIMAEHTWEKRVGDMLRLIEKDLA